jgi:hypothetical protein
MQPTTKNNSIAWTMGLIAGLVMCVFTLCLYRGGVQLFMSGFAWSGYLIITGIAVFAGLRHKKMNGGYLSLSEGLRTVFLVFALGFLLQTLFTYVLFNYIDVPFRDALTQAGMKKAESLMKRLGASENQIEEAMKNANDPKNNSFGNTLLSYAVLCVIFFIISLIIAAIIRKKKPAFENSFNQ